MLVNWLRENGYLKPEEGAVAPPSGAQKIPVSPDVVQQPTASVVMPQKINDPERKKFRDYFFSALRRVSPKFFELQEFIHKFEKTIGTERERYATALIMSNTTPADILSQIKGMETTLNDEMSTAVNQLKASGERELSDKKMQAENLKKRISDLRKELATLESDERNLGQDLAKIQQANNDMIESVNGAAAEVQNELTVAKTKIGQYGSTA